ncbi:MAG: 50S ribosomal protein L35 [Candidatus Omnitrophica bacterium CG07_land_8_20_14_0_80_42_15]|uniref:Large ribosomal subunit protein bL35 n=1 Tax=Candidatus Aquitaenariimonas noxiae TaxID=1974741 RepID=A0A2J0KRL8_9BACT|nr:MAG: 50S ribosomal protein L35 [Candidatus Omnitrophica bacterium CG07_land_8_20_14_0_80_42_15]
MPKMKTNKSAAKRIRALKSGKFKRGHAGKGHILTSKSRKRKMKLRQSTLVHSTEVAIMKKLLPYG